ICLETMEWDDEKKQVVVRAFWTKEEKQARLVPFSFHCTCAMLENACTSCTLREYATRPRVKYRRRKARKMSITTATGPILCSPFLIAHRGRAAAIAIGTIRRDLQGLMNRAGIDPVGTPHDLRDAVASKLLNLRAGEERVMELGRW